MLSYQQAGARALTDYLGTEAEIDFQEVNQIIAKFKDHAAHLCLKRMGRKPEEVWYESVPMEAVKVLIIEWTHGNNPRLQGIDLPILLNSTPEETLAHRRSRNRDGNTDSAFTTLVLAIEQQKLYDQAKTAGLIVLKNGELVDYATLVATYGQKGGSANGLDI